MTVQEHEPKAKCDWLVELMQANEVSRRSWMKPNAVSLDGIKLNKQTRQGAPQLTDDGYLGIVEVVSEEQRALHLVEIGD